jgi:multiple sugar transport system substrate-binding protein
LHQSPESPVKGKVGVTRLPHFQDHSSVSTIGGWHIAISRYSDAKEAAWEFIRFITSYESQKNLLLQIGWTPGRSDVYRDEEIIARIPHIQILEEALNHVATRPRLPYYSQVSDVVQRMVNNCLAGKMAPQEALETIQKEVNEITRIYGNE